LRFIFFRTYGGMKKGEKNETEETKGLSIQRGLRNEKGGQNKVGVCLEEKN